MKTEKESRQETADEIKNSNNYYLLKLEGGDWLCSKAGHEFGLVVFTEKAFNILNKNDDLVYAKHSGLVPILNIAIKNRIPNIAFSTSDYRAVSLPISKFVEHIL